MEHAVDAIADQHLGLHRFDMDVGGALYDSVPQKRIDDAYDWQILGHLLQVVAREVFIFFSDRTDLSCLRRDNVAKLVFQ